MLPESERRRPWPGCDLARSSSFFPSGRPCKLVGHKRLGSPASRRSSQCFSSLRRDHEAVGARPIDRGQGRQPGPGDTREPRPRPALRCARISPLLGVRAPQQRQHRRHRARSADGGDRRDHEAHSRGERRRDAAALFGAQGRRAVPRARGDRARAHRPRRRPRAGLGPADRLALNPHANAADEFPQQVRELQAGSSGTPLPEGHPFRAIKAHPLGPTRPELWILGSSDYGAQLAAHFGLPYAFAYFFSDGRGVEEALRSVSPQLSTQRAPSRSRRRPSASGRSRRTPRPRRAAC